MCEAGARALSSGAGKSARLETTCHGRRLESCRQRSIVPPACSYRRTVTPSQRYGRYLSAAARPAAAYQPHGLKRESARLAVKRASARLAALFPPPRLPRVPFKAQSSCNYFNCDVPSPPRCRCHPSSNCISIRFEATSRYGGCAKLGIAPRVLNHSTGPVPDVRCGAMRFAHPF